MVTGILSSSDDRKERSLAISILRSFRSCWGIVYRRETIGQRLNASLTAIHCHCKRQFRSVVVDAVASSTRMWFPAVSLPVLDVSCIIYTVVAWLGDRYFFVRFSSCCRSGNVPDENVRRRGASLSPHVPRVSESLRDEAPGCHFPSALRDVLSLALTNQLGIFLENLDQLSSSLFWEKVLPIWRGCNSNSKSESNYFPNGAVNSQSINIFAPFIFVPFNVKSGDFFFLLREVIARSICRLLYLLSLGTLNFESFHSTYITAP